MEIRSFIRGWVEFDELTMALLKIFILHIHAKFRKIPNFSRYTLTNKLTKKLFCLAGGLALASLAGCSHDGGSWFGGGDKQSVINTLNAAPKPGPAIVSPAANAAAIVEPAVVTVHTIGRPQLSQNMGFPFGQMPEESVPRGAGSGVIISPDGYIVTNDHVVSDAVEVTVNVNDQPYTAKVIGRDPVSDIAVVKIDTKGVKLTPAHLGDSSELRVGDWAIAVGNPLDIGTTVTLGTISALNRRGMIADGRPLAGTIQTDAAINPGNSGGALADIDGQVIGINEAIASPTGSYVGLGFAIPMNTVRRVAASLIATGHMLHPYIGVMYTLLTYEPDPARRALGISPAIHDGAVVKNVFPGSPAASAGLRPNDIILQAGGETVTDSHQLDDIVAEHRVGDILPLSVVRAGHSLSIDIRLKQRPTGFGGLANQPHQ